MCRCGPRQDSSGRNAWRPTNGLPRSVSKRMTLVESLECGSCSTTLPKRMRGSCISWTLPSAVAHNAFSASCRLVLFQRLSQTAQVAPGTSDNGADHPGLERKTGYSASSKTRCNPFGYRACWRPFGLRQLSSGPANTFSPRRRDRDRHDPPPAFPKNSRE